MRISTKGRYSLEALLYLALLPAGGFASTREIAESTDISERYLEQLFIPLRKNQIIQGIRGSHGGYFLGKEPDAITVADVLRTVDVGLDLVACVNADDCPKKEGCLTRLTWSALYEEINSLVNAVTLKDLTESYRSFDTVEYTI
jgi:Rrf2 family protein